MNTLVLCALCLVTGFILGFAATCWLSRIAGPWR